MADYYKKMNNKPTFNIKKAESYCREHCEDDTDCADHMFCINAIEFSLQGENNNEL